MAASKSRTIKVGANTALVASVTPSRAEWRIAQVVEWDRSGQSCIALIRGDQIIDRFTDYASARAALAVAHV